MPRYVVASSRARLRIATGLSADWMPPVHSKKPVDDRLSFTGWVGPYCAAFETTPPGVNLSSCRLPRRFVLMLSRSSSSSWL